MNQKVTVYYGDYPWFQPYASAMHSLRVVATNDEELPTTSECVLIPQEYAGEKLVRMIRSMKNLLIPVAVATHDGTTDNQEYLLECGANDVIVLPIAAQLLEKRLLSLGAGSVLTRTNVNFAAFDRIREVNQGRGAFVVQENDFANIYRFVVRILERLEQKAQLIIFTFNSDFGPFIETGTVFDFIKVVQAVLRRGDISSIYGRQVFVILMGTDAENGERVVKRMLDTFTAHYGDDTCEITYEMREISSDPALAANSQHGGNHNGSDRTGKRKNHRDRALSRYCADLLREF